jgi:hypothetical protein
VVGLVALVAGPAGADHTGKPHTLRSEAVYFTCDGDSKAQTLANPSWSTAGPSRSVLDGAGCGAFDTAGATPIVTWTGRFTGNLDTADVELHNMLWMGTARQGSTFRFSYTFTADGQTVKQGTVTAPIDAENYGITEGIRFRITGIGLMPEEGNGTTVRTYALSVRAADGHNLWVWDTTEVPSGITFNGRRF